MSRTSDQVNQKSGMSKKAFFWNRNCISNRVAGKKRLVRCSGFRLIERSELSPLKFLKRIGSNVVRALCSCRRPSPRVSSSRRQRPSVTMASSDSHKSEAIEDCIEFINASSSFARKQESVQDQYKPSQPS